jgi:hypothetical protein
MFISMFKTMELRRSQLSLRAYRFSIWLRPLRQRIVFAMKDCVTPRLHHRLEYSPIAHPNIWGCAITSSTLTALSSSATSGQAQRDYIDYVRYMTYFHIGFAAPDKKLSVPLPRVNYYLRSPHPNT